ncbi:hypothetical protein DPMN_129925 [Dreissena polymorpha]|uniref:Transposase n=1 Tax=Dreissena polymorpha TaxID=45954 RepID=A0A9D4H3M6_DREPO|nr:hypothetical protein DPMN_129925 [Dreissena polymorpha]
MMDGRPRFRRTSPRFPPYVWNVHEATKLGEARTNNACESWNNGFKHLVGHANPSLWNEKTRAQSTLRRKRQNRLYAGNVLNARQSLVRAL